MKHVGEDSVNKALKVGDRVKWNIDQDVSVDADHKVTAFGIVDRLDEHVSYNNVTVAAVDSTGNNVVKTFTKDTDYTVTESTRTVSTTSRSPSSRVLMASL